MCVGDCVTECKEVIDGQMEVLLDIVNNVTMMQAQVKSVTEMLAERDAQITNVQEMLTQIKNVTEMLAECNVQGMQNVCNAQVFNVTVVLAE